MRLTCRLLVLPLVGLLGACGGGGGGGDPALALLEGRWFGTEGPRSLEVRFDDDGDITEILQDGVVTGRTGSVARRGDRYYEGELSDGEPVRLHLDSSAQHAAWFGPAELACLERDATTLPAAGFTVADIAPATWSGRNLILDGQARVVASSAATAETFASGSYKGSDLSGLVFGSPAGTGLAPSFGSLEGPYEDNVNGVAGHITILPSPDGTFLVAAPFPLLNSTILNAQFLGVWERD